MLESVQVKGFVLCYSRLAESWPHAEFRADFAIDPKHEVKDHLELSETPRRIYCQNDKHQAVFIVRMTNTKLYLLSE